MHYSENEFIFRIIRGYWFDVGIGVFDAIVWTVMKNLNLGSIFMPQMSGSIAV